MSINNRNCPILFLDSNYVEEQHIHCCSVCDSHCMAFKNEYNKSPETHTCTRGELNKEYHCAQYVNKI
jgi:hypothetical protein